MAKPCMYNLRELMDGKTMYVQFYETGRPKLEKKLPILARHVKHYPGKENISLGEVYTL